MQSVTLLSGVAGEIRASDLVGIHWKIISIFIYLVSGGFWLKVSFFVDIEVANKQNAILIPSFRFYTHILKLRNTFRFVEGKEMKGMIQFPLLLFFCVALIKLSSSVPE